MRRLLLLLSSLAILGTSSPAVCAQAPLRPGARVRFDAPSLGGRMTGTLVAWEADTLVVRVDEEAAALGLIVPANSVTNIEVRRERRMTIDGVGIGLLGGTILALVASPDWVDENGECTPLACLAYKVSPHPETRVAVLSTIGAVVGAIVGSQTKSRKWAPVHLDHVGAGPAPGGGLAFGVRISF